MEKVTCSSALKHPFTCIVSGPTQSGKTEWVMNLLLQRDRMIEPPVRGIIYCYGERQRKLDRLAERIGPAMILHEGVPSREMLNNQLGDGNNDESQLLVLDDLMEDVQNSSLVAELFTRGSHHRNLSVLLISQNLFVKGRYQRTISLNANYLVAMKNPRDRSQIMYLARQIFPDRWKLVQQAYNMATERPHGYLFIDLTQSMDDRFRFRTNIFNEEGGDNANYRRCIVYVPQETEAGKKSINRTLQQRR